MRKTPKTPRVRLTDMQRAIATRFDMMRIFWFASGHWYEATVFRGADVMRLARAGAMR